MGIATILAVGCCTPAAAQVAGKLSLQSDYQVRGYSVSRGRPVGILDLSYDSPSGVYLNGQLFGALPDDYNSGLLGMIGDVGYARRLNSTLSIDGGVTRSEYASIGAGGYHTGYTEIYAGLASQRLSAHLYYSPDYFGPGVKTVYGDVEGNIGIFAEIRLNAHVGALGYLDRPAPLPPGKTQYDWRVGASRQFGAIDVHAALSGGGPSPQFYDGQPRSKTEFIVGAGYTF